MRVVNMNENKGVAEVVETSLEHSPISQTSYHELADKPVRTLDAVAQLHANIMALEELQERLAFVMREVRYQLKA